MSELYKDSAWYSYRHQNLVLHKAVYLCCKAGNFNMWVYRVLTHFRSQPQVAIHGTAVSGTSSLAFYISNNLHMHKAALLFNNE